MRRTSGKWGLRAQEAIREACLCFSDANGVDPRDFPSMTDPLKKTLLAMVDKFYPFGQRDMFPYQAWLKERKAFVLFLYPSPVGELGGLFEGVEL